MFGIQIFLSDPLDIGRRHRGDSRQQTAQPGDVFHGDRLRDVVGQLMDAFAIEHGARDDPLPDALQFIGRHGLVDEPFQLVEHHLLGMRLVLARQ